MAFDYQEYLASREWALLREQVRARNGGRCERCWRAPHEDTHHQTYARVGCERLEDLLGVCRPCHAFLSGRSDVDPIRCAVVIIGAWNLSWSGRLSGWRREFDFIIPRPDEIESAEFWCVTAQAACAVIAHVGSHDPVAALGATNAAWGKRLAAVLSSPASPEDVSRALSDIPWNWCRGGHRASSFWRSLPSVVAA